LKQTQQSLSLVRIIEIAFLLSVVVGIRYNTLPQLMDQKQILGTADDPPYHLRRVQVMISNPSFLYKGDPFVDYPYRAKACWPFGFDGLLTGVTALFFGTQPDLNQIALATSLIIPLLAGFVILLVFFLFRKVTDTRWAVFAMALIGVFFPYFIYSYAGRVDHHVMEPLFAVLALLLIAQKRNFIAGMTAGIAPGFAPAAFIPSYLLVGLVSLLWVYDDHVNGSRRAAVLLTGTTMGAGLALLLSPNPLKFVFYSSSLFHCVFSATGAIAGIGFHRLSKNTRMKPGLALAGYGLVTAILLALVGVAISSVSDSIKSAMNLGTGSSMHIALESLSFFTPLENRHILSGLMIVAGAYAVFYSFHDHNQNLHSRTIALMGVAGWIAAAFQRRWSVGFAPFLVMAAVLGFYGTMRSLSGKKGLPAYLVLIVLLAGYAFLDRDINVMPYNGQMAYKIASYLRDNTPKINEESPEYSVLAPWYMGHVIQTYGHRPTVCDNFFGVPENDQAMSRCYNLFFATDIDKAVQELKRLRVRYIVLSLPDPRAMAARMDKESKNDGLVTKDGRFTLKFAHTLLARLGFSRGRTLRLSDGTILKPLPMFRFIKDFKVRTPSGRVKMGSPLFEFLPEKAD
jgi:asparagine N-glycosylation enzyme membrane subunit Stt3